MTRNAQTIIKCSNFKRVEWLFPLTIARQLHFAIQCNKFNRTTESNMCTANLCCFWYDSEKLQRMKKSFYGFFSSVIASLCTWKFLRFSFFTELRSTQLFSFRSIVHSGVSLRFSRLKRWFHAKLMKSLSLSVANSSYFWYFSCV